MIWLTWRWFLSLDSPFDQIFGFVNGPDNHLWAEHSLWQSSLQGIKCVLYIWWWTFWAHVMVIKIPIQLQFTGTGPFLYCACPCIYFMCGTNNLSHTPTHTARAHSNRVTAFLLQKMEINQEKVRLATLNVIKHLINSCGELACGWLSWQCVFIRLSCDPQTVSWKTKSHW